MKAQRKYTNVYYTREVKKGSAYSTLSSRSLGSCARMHMLCLYKCRLLMPS